MLLGRKIDDSYLQEESGVVFPQTMKFRRADEDGEGSSVPLQPKLSVQTSSYNISELEKSLTLSISYTDLW